MYYYLGKCASTRSLGLKIDCFFDNGCEIALVARCLDCKDMMLFEVNGEEIDFEPYCESCQSKERIKERGDKCV